MNGCSWAWRSASESVARRIREDAEEEGARATIDRSDPSRARRTGHRTRVHARGRATGGANPGRVGDTQEIADRMSGEKAGRGARKSEAPSAPDSARTICLGRPNERTSSAFTRSCFGSSSWAMAHMDATRRRYARSYASRSFRRPRACVYVMEESRVSMGLCSRRLGWCDQNLVWSGLGSGRREAFVVRSCGGRSCGPEPTACSIETSETSLTSPPCLTRGSIARLPHAHASGTRTPTERSRGVPFGRSRSPR